MRVGAGVLGVVAVLVGAGRLEAQRPQARAAITATATVLRAEAVQAAARLTRELLRPLPRQGATRHDGLVWVRVEVPRPDRPRRVTVNYLAN